MPFFFDPHSFFMLFLWPHGARDHKQDGDYLSVNRVFDCRDTFSLRNIFGKSGGEISMKQIIKVSWIDPGQNGGF